MLKYRLYQGTTLVVPMLKYCVYQGTTLVVPMS